MTTFYLTAYHFNYHVIPCNMSEPYVKIDPDGDVLIILSAPCRSFAPWNDDPEKQPSNDSTLGIGGSEARPSPDTEDDDRSSLGPEEGPTEVSPDHSEIRLMLGAYDDGSSFELSVLQNI